MMLGLELHDDAAVAVAVDRSGRVCARHRAAGANLAAAALAALDAVAGPAGGGSAVGVASPAYDPRAHSAVLKAVRLKYSVSLDAPMPSGSASAAAEAWVGAAVGARNVVYFGAGARITSGFLSDGKLFTGSRGRAAAAGWLALNPVDREDYRKLGCLEAEAAAPGIVRRLVWRIKAGDHSRVQELAGGDLTAITLDHLLAAAREGDGLAVSVMRDTAKYLGMAAANLIAVLDPDVVVLGGIMAAASDVLHDAVRSELARRVAPATFDAVRVVPAALGDDSAAIGAAWIAVAALS